MEADSVTGQTVDLGLSEEIYSGIIIQLIL